jgi:hypothetical protein
MKPIEIRREIDGVEWRVDRGGDVFWNVQLLLYTDVTDRLRVSSERWLLTEIETAIRLRNEWLAAVAKAREEEPPRVELPDGMRWERRVSGDGWVLCHGSTRTIVPQVGDVHYQGLKALLAAAADLAARQSQAEAEPDSFAAVEAEYAKHVQKPEAEPAAPEPELPRCYTIDGHYTGLLIRDVGKVTVCYIVTERDARAVEYGLAKWRKEHPK